MSATSIGEQARLVASRAWRPVASGFIAMCLLLLACPLAAVLLGATPADLAPGPDDLARRVERLEALLLRAEAMGAAVARVHNRWGERLAAGLSACRDDEGLSLLADSRMLGAHHRDEVQSSRMEAQRLERTAAAPTVQPFLDAGRRRAIGALMSRVEQQVKAYAELAAWQARYVEPRAAGCTAPSAAEASKPAP